MNKYFCKYEILRILFLFFIFFLIAFKSTGQNKNGKKGTPRMAIQHKEDWNFYLTNVEDKFSSIALDLGLAKIAPIKDQTNIVWVSVKMNNPRSDGLSSSEESDSLTEIEDSLVDALQNKFSATYAGRLTADGRRDLYFYLGDTTLYDKTVSDVMVKFPKYHYDYGSKGDKEWSGYFDFLYPAPEDYQKILNRKVISQLEQGGDKLIKSREVDHWIYFKSEKDRNDFLSKINGEGYTIVNKGFDQSSGEFPYRLNIKRVDNVDSNSIDKFVMHLWHLAHECNGDYDGWETSIEKD